MSSVGDDDGCVSHSGHICIGHPDFAHCKFKIISHCRAYNFVKESMADLSPEFLKLSCISSSEDFTSISCISHDSVVDIGFLNFKLSGLTGLSGLRLVRASYWAKSFIKAFDVMSIWDALLCFTSSHSKIGGTSLINILWLAHRVITEVSEATAEIENLSSVSLYCVVIFLRIYKALAI